MPTVLRASPVLQVRDVTASAAFYTDKLGFTLNGLWGEPPCFAIVQRATTTLMLDGSRGDGPLPLNQYWAAYLYVDDVEALLLEFRERGVEPVRGPEETFYGLCEIDIRDLDGHLLCFGQDLDPQG